MLREPESGYRLAALFDRRLHPDIQLTERYQILRLWNYPNQAEQGKILV